MGRGVSSVGEVGSRDDCGPDGGSGPASDECEGTLGVVGAEEGGESAAEEAEDIGVTLDGYLTRGRLAWREMAPDGRGGSGSVAASRETTGMFAEDTGCKLQAAGRGSLRIVKDVQRLEVL